MMYRFKVVVALLGDQEMDCFIECEADSQDAAQEKIVDMLYRPLATIWPSDSNITPVSNAAPELLAACEKALEDLEVWHSETNSDPHGSQGHQVFYECEGCETCQVTIPQLKQALARPRAD